MRDDDWAELLRQSSAERLRLMAAESLRRRATRAGDRRAAAERRRRGVAARLAWRQARRDARVADDGRPPPDRQAGP